jgi:uncharacterized membrane protein
MTGTAESRLTFGNRYAPPRFVLFVAVLLGVTWWMHYRTPEDWADPFVIGFGSAALAFVVSLWPLLRGHSPATMRKHAAENDANHWLVLLVTVVVSLALLGAIGTELPKAKAGDEWAVTKLVGTLALSWVYTNLVFMLHYAHMFYSRLPGQKHDAGGFHFPGTPEPNYWDFLYFAFTAGMSFAASDVDVQTYRIRRIVVLHSLLSFVFNIGVLAFSINVLAGAAGNETLLQCNTPTPKDRPCVST